MTTLLWTYDTHAYNGTRCNVKCAMCNDMCMACQHMCQELVSILKINREEIVNTTKFILIFVQGNISEVDKKAY